MRIGKGIFKYIGVMLALAGCVDFEDATAPVKAIIRIERPAVFVNMGDMSGIEVTLTGEAGNLTALTDGDGCAEFADLAPGTYDISVAANISAERYGELSGAASGSGIGFVMRGALSGRLIGNDETIAISLGVYPLETLVISKVYASTSKIDGGTFSIGKYIEIYNNSEDTVDAAGLYIGLLESESSMAYRVYPASEAQLAGHLCLKQLFRLPASTPVRLGPGGSLLIANSAVDHTSQNVYERDLTGADFEAKDVNNKIPNNPEVPALELVYTTYSSISCMNLVQGGPTSVVIFRSDEDPSEWPTVYAYGKTKGNQFKAVPDSLVLDGVDIIKNKAQTGPDINSKRLTERIDVGYTFVTSPSGTTGERLLRKTAATTPDGRVILQDTNNSSSDFVCSDTISPRNYLQP